MNLRGEPCYVCGQINTVGRNIRCLYCHRWICDDHTFGTICAECRDKKYPDGKAAGEP